MLAKEGTRREAIGRRTPLRAPLWYLVTAFNVLALALGVFLVVRRATGAFSSSPRPDAVVFAAIILVAWAWLARLPLFCLKSTHDDSLAGELRSPVSAMTAWSPAVVVVLFAIACSYPFHRTLDRLVWPLALVAALLGPRFVTAARRRPSVADREKHVAHKLQELTRYRLTNGRDEVRGTLRAEFAAGERTSTLYVSFCPPFETLPHVEAEVLGGPPASVKLAQVLHQGAQLEVRLSSAAARQQSVMVGLTAVELAAVDDSRHTESPAIQ